jgi:succinoglycan biosynthesis protein ExoM
VGAPRVTVGVCTYRRPEHLARLLEALARQEWGEGPRPEVDVVVVDNSPGFEAAPVVRGARGLDLRYVRLGAGNIAVARNHMLAEVSPMAELLALIDDDEVPEPDWLAQLLAAQAATGADLVTGPVLAVYPPGAPAWLVRGDFLSVTGFPDLAPLHEGITGNALLRTRTVNDLDLRFDESLGLAGGEDQLFFRTAASRGATIRFAARAVAHEAVPAERLTVRYLVRGAYRRGNTLGLLDRARRPDWPPGNRARRLAAAAWWTLSGLARTATGAAHRDRTAALAGLLRVVRAAGMLTGLAGLRYDSYRTRPRKRRVPRD